MKIVGLCAYDWIKSVASAIGVQPYTSPPFGIGVDPVENVLEDACTADVFHIRLHGYLGKPDYYGQRDGVHGPKVLSPQIVETYDWSGVTVFAEVCFGLAPSLDNQRMSDVFLDRGARAFIGSPHYVYGRAKPSILDGEADLLSRYFISAFKKERDVRLAFALALGKFALLSFPLDDDDRATLRGFRIREK